MTERLLTVDEAAERLRIHSTTLRRLLRNGQFPGIRVGNLWRIPESALTVTIPSRQEDVYLPRRRRVPRGAMARLVRDMESEAAR